MKIISWKYTVSLNMKDITEVFICNCGKTNFITKHLKQDIDYTCYECGNRTFYDSNLAGNNILEFYKRNMGIELKYEYDTCIIRKSMTAQYITYVPNKIDVLNKKVIFSKIEIASISISETGKISEKYLLKVSDMIIEKLKITLAKYIKDNTDYFSLPNMDETIELKAIEFILKNKHLKSYKFFYWNRISQFDSNTNINIQQALNIISNNRKEKVVKEAVYQNYINQLSNNTYFNYDSIQLFSDKIKDPNILVGFLKLNLYYIGISGIDPFIDFLKNEYTEEQILSLFSRLDNIDGYELILFAILMNFYEYENMEDLELQNLKYSKLKITLNNILQNCNKKEEYGSVQ